MQVESQECLLQSKDSTISSLQHSNDASQKQVALLQDELQSMKAMLEVHTITNLTDHSAQRCHTQVHTSTKLQQVLHMAKMLQAPHLAIMLRHEGFVCTAMT